MIRFTKGNADEAAIDAEEMWRALPQPKRDKFHGHLTDLLTFLEVAKRAAPEE